MRWSRATSPPQVGDVRVVRRFLYLPTELPNNWGDRTRVVRWLEKATIWQTYGRLGGWYDTAWCSR